MNSSDNILWEGLIKGDRSMFLELYRKYYHSLLFIGLKEVKNPDLVKDAIQQQFLYLWEKRSTLQIANNVKAYLISSFLRKLSADWKRTVNVGKLNVVWSNLYDEPSPTPEEQLICKNDQTYINKLMLFHIESLPIRQKELIKLRFYDGFTYEEIVQKTGLSHRTVYNKIHEAIKKLKSELTKEKVPYRAAFSLFLNLCSFP